MKTLVVWSVIDITLLIAVLAIYLYVVGSKLARVASNLEEASDLVQQINTDAALIKPGLEGINETGGVIAGALPLLYGMAEGIVHGATYEAQPDHKPVSAHPASGRRRSRFLEAVGIDS